ncbi:MAG: hypothetical protein AAGF06_02430 [Pseudomonadota bacterium]
MNLSFAHLFIVVTALLSLGGCSTAAFMEWAHPERVTFQTTDDEGATYRYLCRPKANDAENTEIV